MHEPPSPMPNDRRSPMTTRTSSETMTYPSSSVLISQSEVSASGNSLGTDATTNPSGSYVQLPGENKPYKEEKPDRPKLAIFYFVMYTLVSTYCLIAGKFFKTWYPEMSTFQLLFYRGFTAVIIMFFYMGRETKQLLVDDVSVETFPPLAFRIFQGVSCQFIRYWSMGFFSLSMIGVICKLAPVVTVILAYIVLKERLTTAEITLLVIAVASSLLVTIGDHQKDGKKYSSDHYVAFFSLLMTPLFIGIGTIALRKMKKLRTETLTTHMNLVQITFTGTAMLILNQSFTEWLYIFDWKDWLMMFGMAISVILSNTFKLLAFQNQKASKLQVLGNLCMVYQFLTDLFVFNTHFSSLQYWGIAISAFTFFVDIYMTVADD